MPLRPPPLVRRSLRPWVQALVLATCVAPPLAAQATREYDLKAVFLFNFATFVEWPESARPPAGKPIIIGVLGRDPFGALLDGVVAGEKLRDHPLEVRRYRTPEMAQEAHILYISASEAWRLPQILRFLRGKPVLTVADIPRARDAGAIITFATGSRLELHVNPAAAEHAGLNISSKLLRVATVTDPGAVP